MKYLIFGNGYVGNKFKSHFGGQAALSAARISEKQDVINEISKCNPEWIINCIGKTGRPNIDWCEEHREETIFGNVIIPNIIANACETTGKKMLHIGSGCIYQGDNKGTGFSEEDRQNFFGSLYSRTKAISESWLKPRPVLHLSNERNLIHKLIKYKQIISERNSITVLEDLIAASETLMNRGLSGIYNATNPGHITHAEILDLYKRIVDPKFTYELIPYEELRKNLKADRSNCVLNTEKIEKEVRLRPIG
ncbi:sugar nucleotide-binding protein, partial [Candidatus Woesearchaeota archaeon]|nr:sugar nucleotide-binding protein [Candidatus Woesearchaeota archaeon]